MTNRAIDRFRPGVFPNPPFASNAQPAANDQWVAAPQPEDEPATVLLSPSSQPAMPDDAVSNDAAENAVNDAADQAVQGDRVDLADLVELTELADQSEPVPNPSDRETQPTLPAQLKGLTADQYKQAARRTAAQLVRGAKVLGVPLVWVGVIAFCGGTGYAAFSWLSTIPPAPSCDRLWWFSLDIDKLSCAEQSARSGDPAALIAGLDLVKGWTDTHPLHKKSARLQQDWSKALLGIARQKALHNAVKEAVQLAQAIPPGSPAYKDAQTAIARWTATNGQFANLGNTIETAIKARNWQKAEQQLRNLAGKGDEYQQQQLNRLNERVVRERLARQQLEQLQELVAKAPDDAVTLGQAVRLASQISPHSNAWKEAQDDMQHWSETLALMATAQLEQGHVNAAIAAAEHVPDSISLAPDVRDLLWLNRAKHLSADPTALLPTEVQLWQLTRALAALRQIQPNAQFYDQAQPLIQPLETLLQDLTQLRLAAAAASVQEIPSLQLAIQMAQDVEPDHPSRLYAQSLIFRWRKDMQRAEDRPYLVAAQTLAKSGKIPNLKTAIAQASRVPLGRALRPEAQAAIFDWQQQIQTLEDRPYLQQARRLAKQQKLPQAIQIATKIQPGRSLYGEAQTAIDQWTGAIQRAEDEPILKQAEALANQGSLGAAIDTAAQIAPDRVLYDDAQSVIAGWSAQLAATQRRRKAPSSTAPVADASPSESNSAQKAPTDGQKTPSTDGTGRSDR